MDTPDVAYVCHETSFVPAQAHDVRWLDVVEDFSLLEAFHGHRNPAERYTREDASRWIDAGFADAGIVEDGVVVSRAASWMYSDDAWELAGVFTARERRREGLSRSVCSFVTAAILKSGRMATCHTNPDNVAMRRVIESIGYKLFL